MSIKKTIQTQKKQGKGALIAYITAGDPTPEFTTQIADALIKGGVDILELGLPFSDPIADGPTIQAASLRAINAGTTPMRVLEIAAKIKSQHAVPIVVMTYYNPIFHHGVDSFLCEAKKHGVDGFIVPDLPMEEAAQYRQAAKKYGIDTIFLAAPSTSKVRLQKIVGASSGFLYLVSRYGVTGAQTSVEDATVELVRRVQPVTSGKVALAVGFGISKPEHVKRVIAAGADGAIVGSAFINLIVKHQNDKATMLKALEATARELKAATATEK